MFSIIHDVNWEQQVDCRGFILNQVSELGPVNVPPVSTTDTAACLVSDSSQTIGDKDLVELEVTSPSAGHHK